MRNIGILLVLILIGCASVDKEPIVQKNVHKSKMTKIQKSSVCGKAYCLSQCELESVVSLFNQALKENPNYAGAYWNLAVAYFYKKDYDLSWQNLHKAESLGYEFRSGFKESLRKASGREK